MRLSPRYGADFLESGRSHPGLVYGKGPGVRAPRLQRCFFKKYNFLLGVYQAPGMPRCYFRHCSARNLLFFCAKSASPCNVIRKQFLLIVANEYFKNKNYLARLLLYIFGMNMKYMMGMGLVVMLAIIPFKWVLAEGTLPSMTNLTKTTGVEQVSTKSESLANPTQVPSGALSQMIRSVGGMLFVLALLFAVSVYLKKRAVKGGISKNKRIHLVERLAMDHKKFLVLVEVNNREVLLAVTPQAVTTLAAFDKQDEAGS